MNFRDLEYIVETAKTLSFSRAAENCNVSQPSLSAQIKKLEEHFGARFFHRNKRSVSLTSYGEVFVQQAQKMLAQKAELEQLAISSHDPLSGRLRLGAILTIAPYMFPKIMTTTEKEAPKLKLILKEAKTEELLKLLLHNKIDAAILSLPTDSNAFESKTLFSEDLYLAAPKHHPLANNDRISDKDLDGQNLILLEEGHCFRTQALDICQSMFAKESEAFTATSLETIRQFLLQGSGITLMPAMACNRNDDIAYIPMEHASYKRDVGIVWRKSCNKKPQIEKLISLINSDIFIHQP